MVDNVAFRDRRGAAARPEPARPLPRDPAHPPHVGLRGRVARSDHDLPRPAHPPLRPRPGAPPLPDPPHRSPRDRPPLRDQRRAPRRDRPLLDDASRVRRLPGLPREARRRARRAARAAVTTRAWTGSRRFSIRPRPVSRRSFASSPRGPSSRRSRAGTGPTIAIDAALPFLNRDLGWEDRAWGATEHGFQTLLDRYVKPGDRVLELGAAKSWASQHLVPLGCEYVACDLVVDPLIGLGRGRFFEERVGPYLRIQADGERLPVRRRHLRRRLLRRHAPSRDRPRRDGRRARPSDAPRRHRRRA